ncbi:MAG: phosphotransferase [Firmicutes bacterium]|nr:phosphotransferase [Bacillota bacterium]
MNLDKIIAVRNNKTVFRDGERCLKIFCEDYSKSDVLNEALNQALVEKTGLNIPKITEVTTINGKWAIVSEYIKGKTLERLICENPKKKDEYIENLVDIQMEINSKDCPELIRLTDKMIRSIGRTDLPTTVRYDLFTRLESMPGHNKVCHGDLNPSNVIISDDGTPFVIDWPHASQGDAAADAAFTYLCFGLDGDISGADKYLGLFCKKTGIELQNVQKWLPIAAASRIVRGNAKKREFLCHWINASECK